MKVVLTSYGLVCESPREVHEWYKPIWEGVVR